MSLQRDTLVQLFEEHKAEKTCCELIAAGMSGGMTKGHVSSQLKRLGLHRVKAPKGDRRGHFSGVSGERKKKKKKNRSTGEVSSL